MQVVVIIVVMTVHYPVLKMNTGRLQKLCYNNNSLNDLKNIIAVIM